MRSEFSPWAADDPTPLVDRLDQFAGRVDAEVLIVRRPADVVEPATSRASAVGGMTPGEWLVALMWNSEGLPPAVDAPVKAHGIGDTYEEALTQALDEAGAE